VTLFHRCERANHWMASANKPRIAPMRAFITLLQVQYPLRGPRLPATKRWGVGKPPVAPSRRHVDS
jgi:hypothetical protein